MNKGVIPSTGRFGLAFDFKRRLTILVCLSWLDIKRGDAPSFAWKFGSESAFRRRLTTSRCPLDLCLSLEEA